MNDTFKVEISIDMQGKVKGKIIDLAFLDEYTSFRMEDSVGSFIGKVRNEFISILKDIKNNCCLDNFFIYSQTNRISNMIKDEYGGMPIFEWKNAPGYGVFKNLDSNKWYGIIMNINKNKLDGVTDKEVEIINLKLDEKEILELLKEKGYYKAYHMNKKTWITIILDDTISDEKIMELIHKSYSYTVSDKTEWLVPANPKYFDIEKALSKTKIINWKQSTNIKVGNFIYLYVGSPYSSIMYKLKVLEVNIPYKYEDKNLKMKKVMKLQVITKYKKGKYSFEKLKEYGIKSVRCARYMPKNLSIAINNIDK